MSIPGISEINSAIKEILTILNVLQKTALKAGDFFVNIEKYIVQYANGVTFMANAKNAMAILLTITIPFLGQLIARFMILGGSMDKIWLFLFAMPPLTLVPAIFMMFKLIKPSSGGIPWDNMVWIPLIANTIGVIMVGEQKILNIFKFGLTLGGFMIAYWYKSTNMCTTQGSAKTSKIIVDSLISYMFTIVLAVVLPEIPVIGKFFQYIQSVLPKSELFLQAFAIFIVYVGTNIANSVIPGQCTTTIKEEDVYKTVLLALLLTAAVSFSPGNAATMLMSLRK